MRQTSPEGTPAGISIVVLNPSDRCSSCPPPAFHAGHSRTAHCEAKLGPDGRTHMCARRRTRHSLLSVIFLILATAHSLS